MKILSSFTHPHVALNPWDFCSSLQHKLSLFLINSERFCHSIDSYATTTLTRAARLIAINMKLHFKVIWLSVIMKSQRLLYFMSSLSVKHSSVISRNSAPSESIVSESCIWKKQRASKIFPIMRSTSCPHNVENILLWDYVDSYTE